MWILSVISIATELIRSERAREREHEVLVSYIQCRYRRNSRATLKNNLIQHSVNLIRSTEIPATNPIGLNTPRYTYHNICKIKRQSFESNGHLCQMSCPTCHKKANEDGYLLGTTHFNWINQPAVQKNIFIKSVLTPR